MKALINYFFVVLIPLAIFGISSCENRIDDSSGRGKADFSVGMPGEGSKSSQGTPDSGMMSFHIMISIDDEDGNTVISDSLIPVYAFGTSFTSDKLELISGDYKLTKFLVINPSGVVIYAAPMEGSPLAYLVNDPLPANFTIFTDRVTNVSPEVLQVGELTPGQFGYASFGILVVKPLDFWTYCILDCPVCLRPSLLTTAKLTVFAGNGWQYTFKLDASLNHLIIRGGSDVYKFLLEKEGYPSQSLQFTARELMASTKENPLVLKIPLAGTDWKSLVLQPGPENGKDAMISNLDPDKNFGDHKYFEATFMSESQLTVMRTNRSLIWFNLNDLPKSAVIRKVDLQLSYDLPVPFDPGYLTDTDPITGICRYGGVLQQITEPWDEDKVTWDTQPETITENQVFISPFILNVNMITVDVTSLFVHASTTTKPNYGMMFRLWPVERFPGFRFASGDYGDAAMRPKLVVYYTIN